ncbi:MAG: hypothetical protein ACQESX_05040 [Bacteroidota bacterium]
MKKQETEKIHNLLRLINDYTSKLTDPQGVPEKIIKDILMGHIRDFYERIEALDLKIDLEEHELQQHEPEEQEIAPVAQEKPPQPEPEPSEAESTPDTVEELKENLRKLKQQFDEVTKTQEERTSAEPASEPIPEKTSPNPSPQKPSQPKPQQKPKPEEPRPKNNEKPQKPLRKTVAEKTPPPKGVGEKFNDEQNSLNDFLSGKNQDHSIGERMKHNHITNLKTAIDINHKFLFIRELFDGDSDEYNQVIEKLNNSSDMQEARQILSEYHEKYQWQEKQDTLQHFMEIINRRY